MQVHGLPPVTPPGLARGRGGPSQTAALEGSGDVGETTPLQGAEEAKGVVRNLLNGHFNGVADVRLRINFHDELTAIQQQAVSASAEEQSTALLGSVNAVVDDFLAANELEPELADAVEQARQDFESAVSALLNPEGDVPVLVAADVESGIQAAFDGFVETLRGLFEPAETDPVEPEPGAETVEASGVGEAQSIEGEETPVEEELVTPFEQFIIDLTEAFDIGLQSLQTAVTDAQSVLPALSEPNGQGAAYEKFLAIYNELNGIADVSGVPDGVDLDEAV